MLSNIDINVYFVIYLHIVMLLHLILILFGIGGRGVGWGTESALTDSTWRTSLQFNPIDPCGSVFGAT